MAVIHTLDGDVDDSQLVKSEIVFENDTERTTVVEYCRLGCEGPWHLTHQGDAPGVFCARHIHRSVAVYLKQGLNIAGIAGGIG